VPLEAELLASKAGGQLLRRLQFSHWRQHRDSWARQHESARSTRLAFAELLGDEPRSKPAAAAAAAAKPAVKPAAAAAAAAVKPAAAAATAKPAIKPAAAAATLAPSAASEAPPARARAARQTATRDRGAEAAVGEARLAPEEEEELDNLFDAPPVRSKPKQQRKPPPPPPPPPSAAAAAAAAAAARLRPAGKASASAPAGLQPLERPAKAVKSHKGAGQGPARGLTGAAGGAPRKRRKGNKGEAEGASEKPSRAERLASAFAVGQTAGGKRKFAMS
jgi:hypothetical protein